MYCYNKCSVALPHDAELVCSMCLWYFLVMLTYFIINCTIDYQVCVFWCQVYQVWLLRMHVESWGKPGDSISVLKTLPHKLDIKRHSPNFLYNWGKLKWLTLHSIITPFDIFEILFENIMENGAFALWPFSIIFSKAKEQMLHFP